jgi:hypothetical protein
MPKQAIDWFRRNKRVGPSSNPPASTTKPLDGDPKSGSGAVAKSALDNFTLALDLAEQAVHIAQAAPFVAPAATLLRKIIDSYKACLKSCGVDQMR